MGVQAIDHLTEVWYTADSIIESWTLIMKNQIKTVISGKHMFCNWDFHKLYEGLIIHTQKYG